MLEAKLLAGNSGYDVVVPTSNFLQRQIAADVYLPLDKSKLPNLKNMDPALMEKAQAYDPGNEHAVIYMWGTIGIGYNKAKVEERLGDDAPVDSWKLVFDPEYAAKLADCGITMLDSSTDMLQIALAYLGLDPATTDAADFEKAADLLDAGAALRPLLQLVAVHLRPRERRDLRGGRLLGRRLHRRRAGRGGGERHRDRLQPAHGGHAALVRHDGDPGRRAESRGGLQVDQLHHGAADHRRHHQLRLLRQRQPRLDAAAWTRR